MTELHKEISTGDLQEYGKWLEAEYKKFIAELQRTAAYLAGDNYSNEYPHHTEEIFNT